VHSGASVGWPNTAMALNQEAYCVINDLITCSDVFKIFCEMRIVSYGKVLLLIFSLSYIVSFLA
jgi:hypothetical protein